MIAETTKKDATMQYKKIVTGDDGESYFEDVELPETSAVPEMIVPAHSCVSWDISQGPDGHANDFHTTQIPRGMVVLGGILEIGVSSGEVCQFKQGDIVFATDLTGRGHTSRLIGGPICRVLAIVTEHRNDTHNQ